MKLYSIYKRYILISSFLFIKNVFATSDLLETTIISVFPTPGPSPQGLAYNSGCVWLSDDSTDTIYKIDPTDGSVLLYFDSPGPQPKGLTSDSTNIWCLDDSLRYIYELNIQNGAAIDSIPLPSEVNYLPTDNFPFYGLAWDGYYFYTNFEAGWSSQIIKIDIASDTVYYFSFTAGYSKDITYDGNSIWNSTDRDGNGVGIVNQYEVDGNRTNRFYSPGYYPTGITFDGNYFWITDTGTDSLYQIQVLNTSVEERETFGPDDFILYQNYPNPFNNKTNISYKINKPLHLKITIYNNIGKEVKVLKDQYQTAGQYCIVWDGEDKMGNVVSSGLYYYLLITNDSILWKSMTVIK